MGSGVISAGPLTLQRHAGPEPVVLMAHGVEFRANRYSDKRAKLFIDDAQKPGTEHSVGLGVAHGLPQQGNRTAGQDPGCYDQDGSVLEAGIVEKINSYRRHDQDAQRRPEQLQPHFR